MNTAEVYAEELMTFDYDYEPPLTEDEINGLEIADREIAEGKTIPFSEVLRDLW